MTLHSVKPARALAVATRAAARALRDFLRGFVGLPSRACDGEDDPDTDPRRSPAAARRALEARNARRGTCC